MTDRTKDGRVVFGNSHLFGNGEAFDATRRGKQPMKTVVLETFHNDYSGGGRYCLQLAYALSKYFDVYMSRFDSNDSILTGMEFNIRQYRNDFVPDLFIAASHWGNIEPKGKLNACVCYFPLEQARESLRKYDFAISICDYADRYQKTMWGLPSIVINPYIRMDDFHIAAKDNLIVCVGNYFHEEDGHSKNQHLVLKWFVENGLFKDYELIFTGFVGNRQFYDYLVRKSGRYPNVRVLSSVSFRELADLYSRAKYLVHAIGYRRKLPHQTEHFGYVAVEAMASGCQPIVHNSGGCKDIEGVRIWNDFEEILGRMTDPDPFMLRELSKKYSFEVVLENQIRKLSSLVDDRTTFSPRQQQGILTHGTETENPSAPAVKLNIGCGNDYREGFVNLDNGNCRADVRHDMNVLPYPFEDGRFQYLLAHHSLEHVDKDQWLRIVKELYRISSPGAIWEIMVPYALSDNYFTDPTHRMPFTPRSFDYFDKTRKLGELGGIYGLGTDVRVLESRLLDNKPYGPDVYFKIMVVKESVQTSDNEHLPEEEDRASRGRT